MATLPYWNNDEVISSDKLNSMVQAIINGDPLAVKVSNATKNDVNQIVSYLSSLHDSAKTNLNSATSTGDLDTAYTNMTALVSNKLGSYANDDTVDLYSTGIRASIITFLQAYDNMMSKDRLNSKNTDNTLSSRIDNEAQARSDADTNINNRLWAIQANGGGRNLLPGTRDFSGISIRGDKVEATNNGEKFQVAFGTQNSSQTCFDLVNFHSIPLEKDTDYTASFWVKTSEDTDIWSFLYNCGSNGNYADGATLSHATTEYTRIVVRFHNGNNSTALNFIPVRINKKSTITVWLYGCMLEKGTVAHDWTPAPEDTDDKITALDAKTMQNRGTVSSPDFNSLTQAGYYTVTNLIAGQNYPTTNWGTLEVSGQVDDGNGRLNQKYVGDGGGTIYTRQYNAGTKVWTAWVQMATQNDISSVKDLVNSKTNTTDINWTNVVANSNNTYNYASGSQVTLPNNSSITVNDDRITPKINLPTYFTDYTVSPYLDNLATIGECDNLFIPSSTVANLNNLPTNPDTGSDLTGDCFFTNHYAYSGNTVRAFQKIYSCDYNYVFIRSYNGSSVSWTNWSCLTPYA